MRKLLAILVCKILRLVGKLVGKGSSLPGKYALKICPDILSRVTLPKNIVAVTGSNGKTSTVEMIAAMLRSGGKKVIYNAEGSNQIEGVTTLILSHATITGKVRGDVLLLESDERYARHTFRHFHPTHFVITNLYRDQLTRNGHSEWVYDAILPAIAEDTLLILNADDPLVSSFARNHKNSIFFGLSHCACDTTEHHGLYHDGARCPICKGKMSYEYYHYEHFGKYRCEACGYHRPSTATTVTELDLTTGIMRIDDTISLHLAFRSMYHAYNILAAWALCTRMGVSLTTMATVIDRYMLRNGRMVQFTLGQHHGTLLTSKHENSVAYNTNLNYIRTQGGTCSVLVMVDAISRKYFTGETSWLWDIDFDLLNSSNVRSLILCGKYVNDLALRMDYTSIAPEKIHCFDTAEEAAAYCKANGSEKLYVVTCFSDRDKLLAFTEKEED